jgi:hypothetical protein
MEPQWLMSTWILTEKLSKNYCSNGKSNQEIAKEINDFCSGPNVQFYSYFGSYDWVVLLVIWKDDQFTKTLAKILQRLKTDS